VKNASEVVADFDGIAEAIAADLRPDVLTSAEQFLLRQIPAETKSALDVGCGEGVISRAIAARGIQTLGIDASPRMIELARSQSDESSLLEYRVVDILADSTPPGTFDLVISVAMAHHAPLERVVEYLVSAVAPGGTLIIQDVTTRPGIRHLLINGIAWLARHLGLLPGTERRRAKVQELYDRHGAGERYLNQSDVEDVYRKILPGARIHHHLGWRYTAVWRA
jgi:2-polyprenyl-3-methyl-5-hydroxy-6-metoxy-1,4-benzoquinol methylase